MQKDEDRGQVSLTKLNVALLAKPSEEPLTQESISTARVEEGVEEQEPEGKEEKKGNLKANMQKVQAIIG